MQCPKPEESEFLGMEFRKVCFSQGPGQLLSLPTAESPCSWLLSALSPCLERAKSSGPGPSPCCFLCLVNCPPATPSQVSHFLWGALDSSDKEKSSHSKAFFLQQIFPVLPLQMVLHKTICPLYSAVSLPCSTWNHLSPGWVTGLAPGLAPSKG